ncbi:MAG: zinc ribbon domain-containing protein [Deltaproteobacteria bacterium]|nr:zinc ribbon domain-containing protein [Deltaproteobacteria bacterium]
MPIYEYKCNKCGKEFEMFQGISDPAAKSCKFCKGSVRKMMSLSTFHLKGSGWYATDYGGKKAPAADKKAEAKTESASAPAAEKSPSPSTSKSE